MPQSKMNCVQDVVEAATLYFFADRKQIRIDSDSGSLEEILTVIGYSHVNAPRQAGLNEVACGERVGRNIEIWNKNSGSERSIVRHGIALSFAKAADGAAKSK
jgi:hypothetical protein